MKPEISIDHVDGMNGTAPPQLTGVALPGGTSQLKSDGSGIDDKHVGIYIQPRTGFVIKTKSLSQSNHEGKLFINVCYHDSLDKPAVKKKLDKNGKEIEGINLPLSMGPIRHCQDKAGDSCRIADAIIHPSVKDDIEKDKTGSKRDFVCQVLLQCFDQKYEDFAPLDRKYKLPRMKYIGYVESKTGKIVRKMSTGTEVCKQYVRDMRSKPKIEEVKSSLHRSSIQRDDDANKAVSSKRPPLIFSCTVRLSSGSELSMEEFLATITKLGRDSGESMEPTMVLPNTWVHGSLPLIIDPNHYPGCTVSHIIAKASLESIDTASTTVQASALLLHLSGSNFEQTEFVFPFYINPKKVCCTYNKEAKELAVTAFILPTSKSDSADIGSHPWMLAKALSSCTENETRRKNNEKDAKQKHGPAKAVEDDDPFHLRSTFRWKSIGKSYKQPEEAKLNLPEDRFHAKDSMSQHMMKQQEEEREDKAKNSEKERNLQNTDGITEFVNVNDFKPGGKYCGKGPLEVIGSTDVDHETSLKNAEALLKTQNIVTSEMRGIWCKLL